MGVLNGCLKPYTPTCWSSCGGRMASTNSPPPPRRSPLQHEGHRVGTCRTAAALGRPKAPRTGSPRPSRSTTAPRARPASLDPAPLRGINDAVAMSHGAFALSHRGSGWWPGRSLRGNHYLRTANRNGHGTFSASKVGGWRLAVGEWAVGGWWLVVGEWAVGGWWLVVGGWLLVVGCWWRLAPWRLVVGGWWLAVGEWAVVGWWLAVGEWAVGGWWLVVGGWWLVVGCWWWMAVVGGWRRLAGGGARGLSFRAVVSTKKSAFPRTALVVAGGGDGRVQSGRH